MSHQQETPSGPVVPPEAMAVLPLIANGHRNAVEQLGNAFEGFRPLAVLTSERVSASSSVLRSFLDGIGADVTVVRITAANSNAIAAMREISRAIGFDPKHMSVSEMEDVFKMFLSYQKAHQRRTLICVEEAPDHAQWALDRMEHFVRMETDGKYGLTVILSGNPGLSESLETHALNLLPADVVERIATSPAAQVEAQEDSRRPSVTSDNLKASHVSEPNAIALLHRFSAAVPDAVRSFFSRYRNRAKEQELSSETSGEGAEAENLPERGRLPQDLRVVPQDGEVNEASTPIGRVIVHIGDEIIQVPVLKWDHILIGRSKMCDLRLVSDRVSRHHAMVVHSANGTDLVDLRSTNGTFVGGRQIERHSLQDYDAISIGRYKIRYVANDRR